MEDSKIDSPRPPLPRTPAGKIPDSSTPLAIDDLVFSEELTAEIGKFKDQLNLGAGNEALEHQIAFLNSELAAAQVEAGKMKALEKLLMEREEILQQRVTAFEKLDRIPETQMAEFKMLQQILEEELERLSLDNQRLTSELAVRKQREQERERIQGARMIELTTTNAKLDREVDSLKHEIEKQKREIIDIRREPSQERYRFVSSQLADYKMANQQLEEEVDRARVEAEKLTHELVSRRQREREREGFTQSRMADLKARVDSAERELDRVRQEKDNLTRDMANLHREYDREGLTHSRMAELKARVDYLENELDRARKDKETLARDLTTNHREELLQSRRDFQWARDELVRVLDSNSRAAGAAAPDISGNGNGDASRMPPVPRKFRVSRS